MSDRRPSSAAGGLLALLFAHTSCGAGASPAGDGGAPTDGSSTGADGAPRDAGRLLDAGSRPDRRAEASDDAGGDASSARVVAYTGGYAGMIDWFAFDPGTGALDPRGSLTSFGQSPSFLAADPSATHLYAVDESTPGQVGAYSIDPATGALAFLNSVSSGGDGPPFVSVDATGKYALVANYGDGSVSVLPIVAGGSLGDAVYTAHVGDLAHMILVDPTNAFAFVPCKGSDYVAQFRFDASTGTLTPNTPATVATAAGAGPRHLAFHPDGAHAYLINETNSTLSTYAFDATRGTLSLLQTVSTIPSGFTGTNTAAEVHVHPSGSWVLGSNRGDDSLVVFAVSPTARTLSAPRFVPSGGRTPRDFSLSPAGDFVYSANQTTGNVVPFRFESDAGALTPVATALPVPSASFVGLVTLP